MTCVHARKRNEKEIPGVGLGRQETGMNARKDNSEDQVSIINCEVYIIFLVEIGTYSSKYSLAAA